MITVALSRRTLLRVVAMFAPLIAACGGRDDVDRPTTDGASTGAPSSAAPSDSAADSSAVTAAPLRAACVEGDPAAGSPWRIVGEDSGWRRLPTLAIEDLAMRDSARLAARLASAADALPNDSTGGDFNALPVVVQAAWRVLGGEGDTLFVARTVRRMPIESAPLEETTLLIAVPAVRTGTRATVVVPWSQREVTVEEKSDPFDLATAFADSTGPLLLFVRTADEAPEAELIHRQGTAWIHSWRGTLPRCIRP
jgi:hypothetical protein